MFETTFGLTIIGIFYFLLGFLPKKSAALKIIGFGMCLIEVILLTHYLYVVAAGADYTLMLRANFYLILILNLSMFMAGTYMFFAGQLDLADESSPDDQKWVPGTGKWEH